MNTLFTQPTCPSCPAAKKKLAELGIEYNEVNASTDDGMMEAIRNCCQATPMLVMNGQRYDFKAIMNNEMAKNES
jgi:glutaredoxin